MQLIPFFKKNNIYDSLVAAGTGQRKKGVKSFLDYIGKVLRSGITKNIHGAGAKY